MKLDQLSPELLAATAGGSFGLPRSFEVARDGRTVVFLRSSAPDDPTNALWVLRADEDWQWEERLLYDPADGAGGAVPTRALDERMRERASGITRFSHDAQCDRVAFQLAGAVWLCDTRTGECGALPGVEAGAAALLSPDGTRLAVASPRGVAVHNVSEPGAAPLVVEVGADEEAELGVPDFIGAEEIHRFEGMWWAPDSEQLLIEATDSSAVARWTISEPSNPDKPARRVPYPVAGGPNAVLGLRLLDCSSGEATEITWSHDEYPYLWSVVWSAEGGLTVEVETRDQTRLATFAYDPERGVLEEREVLVQEPWAEVGTGTRAHGPRGELCRVAHVDGIRTLLVGDVRAQLPVGVNISHFLGRTAGGCLVQVMGDATEREVALVGWDGAFTALGEPGAVAVAWGGGQTVVLQKRSLATRVSTRVLAPVDGARSTSEVASSGLAYEWEEDVELINVEPGRIRSALLIPSWYRAKLGSLPVLVSSYGGPMLPRVLKDRGVYLANRWFAEQGFAVLVTDGTGTPGAGPEVEAEIRGDFTRTLDDQIAALERVLADHPHLDGERVGIRGWSFGGYLSALAAIRAPRTFHAAVAGAPVSDWMLYDTHYTERYLGVDDELRENALRCSLDHALEQTAKSGASVSPMLLIHGLSDDNVFAAHTVRLSEALMSMGILHTALLPSSLTHVSRGNLTAKLLHLELAYLAEHLRPTGRE